MSWRQLLGSHVLVATFWRQYPGENVLAAMVYRQPCPGINVPKATFQLSGPAGPDLAAPSWRPHPVTTSWNRHMVFFVLTAWWSAMQQVADAGVFRLVVLQTQFCCYSMVLSVIMEISSLKALKK